MAGLFLASGRLSRSAPAVPAALSPRLRMQVRRRLAHPAARSAQAHSLQRDRRGDLGYKEAPSPRKPPSMPTPSDAELRVLADSLGTRLRASRDHLVTAESCTGGWIAKTVTDIAGSSDWFDCGMVAYSYEAKQALLGVRAETLELHGAVSRETVVEMVSGALVNSGASIAAAVTGIAGPGGGSDDKPVGTVWIGWKRRGGYARAEVFLFDGDRDAVRRQTVAAALRGLEDL
jgi:nicotinamide-nucleotide amidase